MSPHFALDSQLARLSGIASEQQALDLLCDLLLIQRGAALARHARDGGRRGSRERRRRRGRRGCRKRRPERSRGLREEDGRQCRETRSRGTRWRFGGSGRLQQRHERVQTGKHRKETENKPMRGRKQSQEEGRANWKERMDNEDVRETKMVGERDSVERSRHKDSEQERKEKKEEEKRRERRASSIQQDRSWAAVSDSRLKSRRVTCPAAEMEAKRQQGSDYCCYSLTLMILLSLCDLQSIHGSHQLQARQSPHWSIELASIPAPAARASSK